MSKPLSETTLKYTPLMTIESAVVHADSKKTDIIRTGIPVAVRDALKLKAGDRLIWDIVPEGNKLVAIIYKKGDFQ